MTTNLPLANISIPSRSAFSDSKGHIASIPGAEIASRVLHKHLKLSPLNEEKISDLFVAKGMHSTYSNDYAREVIDFSGLSHKIHTANFSGGSLSTSTALQNIIYTLKHSKRQQGVVVAVESAYESPALSIYETKKIIQKISTIKSVGKKLGFIKHIQSNIWDISKGGFQSSTFYKRLHEELKSLALESPVSPSQLRKEILQSHKKWKSGRLWLETKRNLVPIFYHKNGTYKVFCLDDPTTTSNSNMKENLQYEISPRRSGAAVSIITNGQTEPSHTPKHSLDILDFENSSPSHPKYHWKALMSAIQNLLHRNHISYESLGAIECQELSALHAISIQNALKNFFCKKPQQPSYYPEWNSYGGCLSYGFFGSGTLLRQIEHLYYALKQKGQQYGIAITTNPGSECSLFLVKTRQHTTGE